MVSAALIRARGRGRSWVLDPFGACQLAVKKKKRNGSSSMQLIKAKSETLYYENCFCSESIGTSFYQWYTQLNVILLNHSQPFVLDKNYYSYLFDFKPFANELMVSWLLLPCIFAMMCLFVMFRTFRFDKLFWHAS